MPTDSDKRLDEIESRISEVVNQKCDDVCWMDVYTHLAGFIGTKITSEKLALLPREDMLKNCARFIDALQAGCPYEKDSLLQRLVYAWEKLSSSKKEKIREILDSPAKPKFRVDEAVAFEEGDKIFTGVVESISAIWLRPGEEGFVYAVRFVLEDFSVGRKFLTEQELTAVTPAIPD